MSIYSLALRTTNVTAGQPNVEIYTPSTLAVKVMEIGFALTTATAGAYGLGRPSSQGITPVAAVFLPEQNSVDPTAKTNASLSWGTPPGVPAAYLRRVFVPATIGAGVIWTFPRGLYIPVSASLVLHNIVTPAVLDVWIVIDE